MKIMLTGSIGFVGGFFRSMCPDKIVPFSFEHDDIDKADFADIESVVHLAALVHQMDGAPDEAYERINTDMTLALARKAKAEGVKYFLFMSTVKVYGEERETCYLETDHCSPSDAYGVSKLNAEKGLLGLEDDTFKVGIVRSPLVYGEGVGANMLNLMKLVDRFGVLPFGSIRNRRSMVYVGNLCRCLEAMVEQKVRGIYNVADSEKFSTTSLIRDISDAMGKQCILVRPPLFSWLLKYVKPALYRRLYGSLCIDTTEISKALPDLKYYSKEEGVGNMVRWYKND
jgi:UDP-glucose 4-epimerase